MSSSDSLGDVFRVGSTPFRKPAWKDGKYTWIMFERLTGFLQPLVQYCLCRLTVFPCYWKAKKKRARRNAVAFRSPWKFGIQVVRQDRKMKSFFPFFFLAMPAKNNMIFDSFCAWKQCKTMLKWHNVTATHILWLKRLKCHIQFLTQYKVYTWFGQAEFPATESAYWLVIHGCLCVLSNTREKHVCLSRCPRGVSCPRTLNWPLVLLSSFFLIVVMAIPQIAKPDLDVAVSCTREALQMLVPLYEDVFRT